jgi:hypothetical protein
MGGNIGWWQQPSSVGGRAGRRYLQEMDFGMQEKFFVNYTGYWNTGSSWITEVRALRDDIRATGSTFFGLARGSLTNRNAMLFALGSYLCITDRDGRAAFQYLNTSDNTRVSPYFEEYDIAESLGAPAQDVQWHSTYQVGYRRFGNGYVVVNPNTSNITIRDLSGLFNIDGVRVPSTGAVISGRSAGLFFNSYPSGFSVVPEVPTLGVVDLEEGDEDKSD